MVYLWSCLLILSSKTFSQPPCRWPSCPIAPGQWPYGQPRCQPPWPTPPCLRSSLWKLFNIFLVWHMYQYCKNIPSKWWISPGHLGDWLPQLEKRQRRGVLHSYILHLHDVLHSYTLHLVYTWCVGFLHLHGVFTLSHLTFLWCLIS